MFPLQARAQDPPQPKFRITVPYDGPELFARLLDHVGLKPIESLDQLVTGADKKKTIIVVFGNCDPLVELENKLGVQNFLNEGGALLIASDRQFEFHKLPSLGCNDITIDGHFYECTFDGAKFGGQERCPILRGQDLRRTVGELDPRGSAFNAARAIFSGIRDPRDPKDFGIALNCPSALRGVSKRLTYVAYLPKHSGVDEDQRRPPHQLFPYLAVGAHGRWLVAAGNGVFTNCMLAQDDVENRPFALNVIRWLKDDGTKEGRTHVLFVADNRPVSNFKVPLIGPPRLPMPKLERILQEVDKRIRQLEDRGPQWIDNLIANTERNSGFQRNAYQGAVILGTLALLAYGVKKFVQRRHRLEATPAAVGAPPPPAPSRLKQQVREMVFREQLGEAARALARDWFRTYANVEFAGGQVPAKIAFTIHAGILQRRGLTKRVETLWRLAADPAAAGWDAKRLRELTTMLEELALSAAGGQIVFDR